MRFIESKSLAVSLLLLGAGGELACCDSAKTDALQWGPTIGGLQMATSLDKTFGVIRCWVRNGGTVPVTYDHSWFGYWEFYGLEVCVGTEWSRLKRAGFFLFAGGLAADIKLLRPGQLISDVDDERFVTRSFMPPASQKPDFHVIAVTTQRLEIVGARHSQKPDRRGASFTLQLLDFAWPPKVLERSSVEVRVYQTFRQACYSEEITLCSPAFALDCSMIRTMLDRKTNTTTPMPH